MPTKTVYILGAGASVSAHLPMQAWLLSEVYSLSLSSFDIPAQDDADFLSLPLNNKLQRMQEFYSKFDEYRQNLGRFIVSNFSSSNKLSQYEIAMNAARLIQAKDKAAILEKEALLLPAYSIVKSVNVSLEDLFTIFDSVASGREHFRLYSSKEMADLHNQLKLCIIFTLSFFIANNCDNTDYKKFCKHLLRVRNQLTQKEDALAVITMNWDDILEKTLSELCINHNNELTRNQIKTYPDLCFYDYSLSANPEHIPSTHIKAKGHKNIKILKMHGSLAWLKCPKCGRIYTDYSNEIASEEFSDMKCPHCSDDSRPQEENPILRSLIITPTFLKSLENLNLKNIWHNAFIDISEADEIVFIGYSFPDADFEMRCLLKKACKSTAKIHVVLSAGDDPETYTRKFTEKGFDLHESNKLIAKMRLPEERYKSFFGEDRVTFNYCGFAKYIDQIGGTNANE